MSTNGFAPKTCTAWETSQATGLTQTQVKQALVHKGPYSQEEYDRAIQISLLMKELKTDSVAIALQHLDIQRPSPSPQSAPPSAEQFDPNDQRNSLKIQALTALGQIVQEVTDEVFDEVSPHLQAIFAQGFRQRLVGAMPKNFSSVALMPLERRDPEIVKQQLLASYGIVPPPQLKSADPLTLEASSSNP